MPGQLSLFGGKRQRGVKRPSAPEYALHCMVADTLRRWGNSDWRWTHIASGEKRTPRTAGRLKRMGVQKGWHDFILLSPQGRAHFLELKRKGGSLTDEQCELAEWMRHAGYPFAMADNYNDAVIALRDWGAVRTTIEVQ